MKKTTKSNGFLQLQSGIQAKLYITEKPTLIHLHSHDIIGITGV